MDINPVLQYRNEHRLTRKELSEITGLSQQVIYKTELGHYNILNQRLADLPGLSSIEYTNWLRADRKLNRSLLPPTPVASFMPYLIEHRMSPIFYWRSQLEYSQHNFCRLLHVHSHGINQLELLRQVRLPSYLQEALFDMHYESYAKELQEAQTAVVASLTQSIKTQNQSTQPVGV